jgi:PKD repeat protein
MATLTVTDNDSATGTYSRSIAVQAFAPVNIPPLASFEADPQTGQVPLTVSFDASGTTDTDGTIASYSWDFGDGQTSTGVLTTHEYVVPAIYIINLTVTDDDGATGASTAIVTVTGPATSPSPSSSPDPSVSPSAEPTASASPDPTTSPDPSASPTFTATPDPSVIPSAEPTASASPNPTPSLDPSASPDPTTSPDPSTSPTFTATPDPSTSPEPGENSPPEFVQIPPQEVEPGEVLDLDPTVYDDGLPDPPADLAYQWSVSSGLPQDVKFSDLNSRGTQATFAKDGQYELSLEIFDGEHSVTMTVAVTVQDKNAGSEISITGKRHFTVRPGGTVNIPVVIKVKRPTLTGLIIGISTSIFNFVLE